jgi:hypothetical protein
VNDRARVRAQTAARVRRWRARQADEAERRAERQARRAVWLADKLEAESLALADLIARDVPHDLAEALVGELQRRRTPAG